ncbi:MAG: ATP-grasp domain-containing protein [Adlercreutzia sp.]
MYTNSENALAWIVESAHNESLSRAIGLFKDKAAMRAALAGLDPDLFFKSCSVDELFKLDFSQLPAPFVLKPSVGFCSMGVYAIQNREDWGALWPTSSKRLVVARPVPESVIGAGSFILEGYLEGTEYALDAYFDEQVAHILNVLRHDFTSPEDTSDRMYVTSASIVRDTSTMFASWLDRVNALIGARNFRARGGALRVETGM